MEAACAHGRPIVCAHRAAHLPAQALSDLSFIFVFVFYIFILLAALTVMNMLIGVLCEVVSAVAATEKESITVQYVKARGCAATPACLLGVVRPPLGRCVSSGKRKGVTYSVAP